jgi:2-oxo-4-hydroxy-4-carboxy-5-ureidoimidazoline decarboxylase
LLLGDKNALKEKFSKPNSWEGGEQMGANSASEEVLDNLALLNDEYELRNGFIFIICATGKSAQEMLDAIKNRIHNDRDTEVSILHCSRSLDICNSNHSRRCKSLLPNKRKS